MTESQDGCLRIKGPCGLSESRVYTKVGSKLQFLPPGMNVVFFVSSCLKRMYTVSTALGKENEDAGKGHKRVCRRSK